MVKGLPKSIIKKYGVTKKAWQVFRGRKSPSRTRRARPARRTGGSVTRRRYVRRRRGGGKPLLPKIFKWIRVSALVGPGAYNAIHAYREGWGLEAVIDQVVQTYTGYSFINRTYDPNHLAMGWGPYLMSVLTTVGIPKLAAILRRL